LSDLGQPAGGLFFAENPDRVVGLPEHDALRGLATVLPEVDEHDQDLSVLSFWRNRQGATSPANSCCFRSPLKRPDRGLRLRGGGRPAGARGGRARRGGGPPPRGAGGGGGGGGGRPAGGAPPCGGGRGGCLDAVGAPPPLLAEPVETPASRPAHPPGKSVEVA